MRGRAAVHVPAGISSFFEAYTSAGGRPIGNPARIGARGGGFVTSLGVLTIVEVEEGRGISVTINGSGADARTSRAAVELALRRLGAEGLSVRVEHRAEVPVGAGFGTSAAGALGAALALSLALRRPITLEEGVRIAHVADVVSKTGLGTAEGFLAGGCVLITRPGAPGLARVDRIVTGGDLYIVALHFGPISKAEILSSEEDLRRVNEAGRRAMRGVLRNPTVGSLLAHARRFAEESGIGDPEMLRIADDLARGGAIGATQNMIGRAVHAAVGPERLKEVVSLARNYGEPIVSKVHEGGPRVLQVDG